MLRFLLLFIAALVWRRNARAQLGDGRTPWEFGGTAILPCKLTRKLTPDEKLLQISWQRKTEGKPQTDNFLTITAEGAKFVNGDDKRFRHIGSFADHNGTLQLSNVNLKDDGIYTCIFSIFPTENPRITIPLTVFLPPQRSVKDATPTLGDKEVPLATCTAAGFNPPAKVAWKTDALTGKVNSTSNSTLHASGATTTVSTLLGKPTKEIHGSEVQCNISVGKDNWILPFRIQIYYPPLVVSIKEGPKDNPAFTCEADANPAANITWSRSGNPLPSSVKAEGATLSFEVKTADLTGLYQCEAYNTYGSQNSPLYVHFPPGGDGKGGWVAAFWIVLLLLLIVLCVVGLLYVKGFLKLPRLFEGESVPTSSPREEANDSELMEQRI